MHHRYIMISYRVYIRIYIHTHSPSTINVYTYIVMIINIVMAPLVIIIITTTIIITTASWYFAHLFTAISLDLPFLGLNWGQNFQTAHECRTDESCWTWGARRRSVFFWKRHFQSGFPFSWFWMNFRIYFSWFNWFTFLVGELLIFF